MSYKVIDQNKVFQIIKYKNRNKKIFKSMLQKTRKIVSQTIMIQEGIKIEK
jgi:hypothetical protein